MEQEFYRDEFEQLLKDTTDDFKMYPSRKVWHSIYNDLHPDRKWPSFAVCLLLLTVILYVGVNNNNAISSKNRNISTAVSFNELNQPATGNSTAGIATEKIQADKNISIDRQVISTASLPAAPFSTDGHNLRGIDLTGNKTANDNNTDKDQATTAVVPVASFDNIVTVNTSADSRFAVTPSTTVKEETSENASATSTTTDLKVAGDATENSIPSQPALSNLSAVNLSLGKDTRELEWIEDFAFHNRKNAGKSVARGWSTQFYVTPSVGYRVMFKNKDYESVDNSLVNSNVSRNEEKPDLNQAAAMNMEAGLGVTKDLNNRLRLKAGIQFNYTDYITYAQRLDHPTETNLVVGDPGMPSSLETFSASYARMPGKNDSKLHNSSIQLSLPVGLDYRIINKGAVSWYVGATVQPTMVARSYSYLLSADNNYFIDNRPMLRKWNLNGALESFVSIKIPSGTYINLGPQFRYQLISSYSKNYMYTEKPYSVGFKIGFTRPL